MALTVIPQEEIMSNGTEKMDKLGDNELANRVKMLELEMQRIRERNVRVEMDKAWEASSFRVVFLVILTYFVTSMVFWLIGVPSPFLNALIPTTGYYLSTLSLPFVKKWWIQGRKSSTK